MHWKTHISCCGRGSERDLQVFFRTFATKKVKQVDYTTHSHKKRQLELLSPARDVACGIAAIDHGADAVYIGAPQFGARAAAGNSIDDIERLCQYAHQYGARVYVTVNTIVYDDELPLLRRLLRQIAAADADAVLFQDMTVPVTVKEEGLPLQLHASTQTDNRTAEKVGWLRDMGASRVVLARELSAEEIAAIHRQVSDVELEVFVHGALCVSYSGQCYASQHCFGRSANRGECAQMCRMKFDLTDSDGRTIQRARYLLSLKDLNQSGHIAELIEAGATSLKIEGRLKDIGYVKNVTAAYSQLLDSFIASHPDDYERASRGHCRYSFTPDLRKTFNRGYTTFFLHGRQQDIFSPDTPKAMGEFVGIADKLSDKTFEIQHSTLNRIANGDGLCFIDDNRELQGFRVNRADGNRLTVAGQLPPTLRRGTRLYRNNDQALERLLAVKSAERKIPVTMILDITDDGFRLDVVERGERRDLRGERKEERGERNEQRGERREERGERSEIVCEHQKAMKPQRENIVRELSKLGNTPYECVEVILPEEFDWFIPASRLSELRRKAVESSDYTPTAKSVKSLNTQHSTLNTQHPTLNTQHSTLNPQLLTLNSKAYMLNVANKVAREFYRQQGIETAPAFELQEPEGEKVLMVCRHCLRYALGHCTRHGGTPPTWREPLFLSLANGRRFRLRFDCKNCQMEVISDK